MADLAAGHPEALGSLYDLLGARAYVLALRIVSPVTRISSWDITRRYLGGGGSKACSEARSALVRAASEPCGWRRSFAGCAANPWMSSGNLLGSSDGRDDPSQIQQPSRFFDLTLPHGFSIRFGYAVSTVVPVSVESDRHQRPPRRALPAAGVY